MYILYHTASKGEQIGSQKRDFRIQGLVIITKRDSTQPRSRHVSPDGGRLAQCIKKAKGCGGVLADDEKVMASCDRAITIAQYHTN